MTAPLLPRVLVVDDEPLMRRVMTRELSPAFEVLQAEDLAQAVEHLAREEGIVAVVSDLDLGAGNTGLQVLDETRRRLRGAIRILVSARATPEDVEEECRDSVIQDFLQKPWGWGELLSLVQARLAAATMGLRRTMKDVIQEQASGSLPPVRDGDEDATAAVFLKWHRLLLWRIHHVHGVPFEEAEDVLQETYERFLPYPIRIEHPRRLLMAIAESVAMDYHRHRAAATRALRDYALAQQVASGSAEDRMAARLDARRAIAAAKGKCYEILTTVMLLGATHTEYAHETGTPRGTIGTTLTRCLDKVRRHMARRAQQRARQRRAA